MEYYFESAVCTDKGNVRGNNEDNFCLNGDVNPREKMDIPYLARNKASIPALFAVCDGMGGEEKGEEASFLSVTILSEFSKKQPDLTNVEALNNLMKDGCKRVLAQAQANGVNSGATVSVLVSSQKCIRIVNMGDSRIYRLSNRVLTQLSKDHTEISRMLSRGEITQDQVATHPKRHMIYQYWGMPIPRAPFMPYISAEIPLVEGDRYLICSDGLTDMVPNEEIAEVLQRKDPVIEVANALVRHAKRNGGKDNVTVLVAEVCVKNDASVEPEPLAETIQSNNQKKESGRKNGSVEKTREIENDSMEETHVHIETEELKKSMKKNVLVQLYRKLSLKKYCTVGVIGSMILLLYCIFEWLDMLL